MRRNSPVFHFGVRDCRLAPGAPVHHAVAAFEHAPLLCPGKGPPGSLDILGLHGLVRTREVQPDPEGQKLVVHQLLVFHCELPALLDEGLDAELLDVLLGRKTERLLDLDLNGEAVHVVAGPVDHVPAVHALVTQDRVLDDLVPRSAEVDMPGGVWRAVHEKDRFGCRPQLFHCLVGSVGAPVFLHLTLDLFCAEVRGDFLHLQPLFVPHASALSRWNMR